MASSTPPPTGTTLDVVAPFFPYELTVEILKTGLRAEVLGWRTSPKGVPEVKLAKFGFVALSEVLPALRSFADMEHYRPSAGEAPVLVEIGRWAMGMKYAETYPWHEAEIVLYEKGTEYEYLELTVTNAFGKRWKLCLNRHFGVSVWYENREFINPDVESQPAIQRVLRRHLFATGLRKNQFVQL